MGDSGSSDDDDSDDSNDSDSDSINVTGDSDDSDDSDSSSFGTSEVDSASDDDSDDNSFNVVAFAHNALEMDDGREHVLLDKFDEDDSNTQDLITEGDLTVSLSASTMYNLWGIAVLFVVVNVTLCCWCHLKSQKGKKKVRFEQDVLPDANVYV